MTEIKFGHLSGFEERDETALVEYLNEAEIHRQTLAIPSPYTLTNARWWIKYNLELTEKNGGRLTNWAIRRKDGKLIGVIGFHELKIGDHKSELGYWLAKPYWSRGIMTDAVLAVVRHGFDDLGLMRVAAGVFASNHRSASVLAKAGFSLEATLPAYYIKDGKIFDGEMFVRISDRYQKGNR